MTASNTELMERLRQEYKRCGIDPKYFIRKYCYISEQNRGKIPFDLFKYQEDAIDDFLKNDYTIVLKGRQIGISTVAACLSLWLMLFYPDKMVLVIATKMDSAKNMIDKVRYAYDNLPEWLRLEKLEDNKTSIKFKNNSKIKASAAAGDAGRSDSVSLLILDEAAHIKNAKEIWTSAFATLSTGGKAILISSPNGVGNFFHQTYSIATQGLTKQSGAGPIVKFHPIKLDWKVHPNRDQAWRDKMGSIQGEREARQEFDAEFIGSGNTVVDPDLIEWYAKEQVRPWKYTMGTDGGVRVWEDQDYTRQYVVVADVARGDGEDYSAFHVLDVEKLEQVAEYKGQLGTTEYARLLHEIAVKYNNALLVVERENVGWAVLQAIIDQDYANLFYMSKDHKIVETHKTLNKRYQTDENQMLPGFSTTSKTRPLIISKLDTYMRDKEVTIRSLRLIEELRVFIWENHKPQAMEGMNDDLVMALAIGLWVRDVALRIQQSTEDLTKASLESIKKVGYDGVYKPTVLGNDPFVLPSSNNGFSTGEDIRWLL